MGGESAPPQLGGDIPSAPQVRSCFRNLARRFWNQTWTRASVSSMRAASSSLFDCFWSGRWWGFNHQVSHHHRPRRRAMARSGVTLESGRR